jgi:hypothetical protein
LLPPRYSARGTARSITAQTSGSDIVPPAPVGLKLFGTGLDYKLARDRLVAVVALMDPAAGDNPDLYPSDGATA